MRSWLLSAVLVAPSAAWAGTVYVNGVRADGLRGFSFEDVDVRVDDRGDVWIDAPKYRVAVADPGEPIAPATAGAVPAETWWLVSEDLGSAGHVIEVLVNGTMVRRVRSGDPVLILDLAPYLRRGENTVRFAALPGSTGGGGLLTLVVGSGENTGGTIRLSKPAVRWSRRASEATQAASHTATLTIP